MRDFSIDAYNVPLNAHIVIAIHNGILLQWYMNRKEIDGPMTCQDVS